jgi:RNA polymerase sigma factor, sigma-70 family
VSVKEKEVIVLEDTDIIELFYNRSEQAIKELSEKYGAVCSQVSKNILKNSQDAEECVNDAYLAVWNTIPPQKPEHLLAYICRIVRNISITKYHSNTAKKRNSYYDTALDELDECIMSGLSVEDEIDARELSCLINIFLDTLSKENRVIFVWRYWFSDSVQDIAEKLGISSNNVSVRLSRIRSKLKKFLKKEGYVV